jgi:hypothetical protein
MIAALLTLQLAIGLQWPAAHAVDVPAQQQLSGMQAGHCAGHAGAATNAPTSHSNPVNKHDCCRSLGCQCHPAQTPVVLDLPWTSADSTLALVPVVDTRQPVAPATEFFRPPIA